MNSTGTIADYCNGDAVNGIYGYSFWAHDVTSSQNFGSCLMSCNENWVSDIVGVARDGFPIYGPMQYYSASRGKIFVNIGACDDCRLVQLNGDHTDACGGIEVADGSLEF